MNAILRFTVENFRSIAERKYISFVPDAIKDEPRSNVCSTGGIDYLRTTAIYGANSSGKSNLVNAISCMSAIIVRSVKMNDNEPLPYFPFRLDKQSPQNPTLYELDFVVEGIRYRYGFSNRERNICEEWLSRVENHGGIKHLFVRNAEGIGVNEKLFPEGKNLESRTNDNRLFLSLVGQLGGSVSNSIIHFFDDTLNVLSGLDTDDYTSFTKHMLNDHLAGCEDMKHFFSRVRLGFSDLSTTVHEFDAGELPADLPHEMRERLVRSLSGKKRVNVFATHGIYDEEGKQIETADFNFTEMESAGTQKLFDMAGPIFDTLHCGSILVIDELDAKMHPIISRELVALFNDPLRNAKGAQLVFTTHDTNLLSSHLLRRDQVWFTEKDSRERTDVYSLRQIVLPDGTKPRGDGNLERNYIRGRYGAVPYIQPETND